MRGVYESQYTNSEREDTGKMTFQNASEGGIDGIDEETQSYEYTDDYRYNAGGTRIPRSGNKMLQIWDRPGSRPNDRVPYFVVECCVLYMMLFVLRHVWWLPPSRN